MRRDKMKRTITEDTKKKLLDTDFSYEFYNMRHTFYEMLRMGTRSPTGEINKIWNRDLIDFLVHIRIFWEFFYGNPESKDKAHAGHYLEDWKDKKSPSDIKEWKERINIFLSHLSYARITKTYKRYPIDFLYLHFRELAIDFLKNLPKEYLTENLGNLLKELEKEQSLDRVEEINNKLEIKKK